jgi:hypothetical protein
VKDIKTIKVLEKKPINLFELKYFPVSGETVPLKAQGPDIRASLKWCCWIGVG